MNPIRILIADDDAGMRLVMRKLAQSAEGYELVGEAENGRQLIEMYDALKPEVVLMDVEMPEMTGIECARAIQDRDPHTVLVFATAHEEYMASAFEVYAFDYLVKPFRVERAMQTLERIRERLRGPVAGAVALPERPPSARPPSVRSPRRTPHARRPRPTRCSGSRTRQRPLLLRRLPPFPPSQRPGRTRPATVSSRSGRSRSRTRTPCRANSAPRTRRKSARS